MTEPGPRRRLGRYELIAEIASGGMGIVCLARSVGVGGFRRLFAIKVMHPHLVKDQQFVGMLLDEAQLAARIHHPNVVATVDICTVDDCYFVVMDYVDGFQLLQVLEHASLNRHDRIRVVNRVLLDAMAGLEAAHTLKGDDGAPINLVHRDVSPQNILIGTDGIGRLTDFGIALAASRISSSRPGTIKGKPSYMAPEQARAAQVDRRADVWALGVILWEALSGQRLFVGDTEAATVLKVIDSPIQPPRTLAPDVPPALDAVCMRALERDPTRRYASARQMAAELERAASSNGLLADSHEVADTLQTIFAAELEHRRMAIRTHVAAIGPNSSNMGARDVYELPLLLEDVGSGATVNVSPLPHEIPITTPSGTQLSAGSAGAALPPTSVAPPTTPAVPMAQPRSAVPGTTAGATREVAMPRPSGRGRGLLIGALVLAAAGGALWFLSQRGAAAPEVAEPAAAPGAETAPASAAAAAPAKTSEVEVAPAVQNPSVEVVPAAPSVASANTPAAPRGPAVISKRPASAPANGKPKASASPNKGEPAPNSGPRGPLVEENPYGLR